MSFADQAKTSISRSVSLSIGDRNILDESFENLLRSLAATRSLTYTSPPSIRRNALRVPRTPASNIVSPLPGGTHLDRRSFFIVCLNAHREARAYFGSMGWDTPSFVACPVPAN
jgi:hypothetical protein